MRAMSSLAKAKPGSGVDQDVIVDPQRHGVAAAADPSVASENVHAHGQIARTLVANVSISTLRIMARGRSGQHIPFLSASPARGAASPPEIDDHDRSHYRRRRVYRHARGDGAAGRRRTGDRHRQSQRLLRRLAQAGAARRSRRPRRVHVQPPGHRRSRRRARPDRRQSRHRPGHPPGGPGRRPLFAGKSLCLHPQQYRGTRGPARGVPVAAAPGPFRLRVVVVGLRRQHQDAVLRRRPRRQPGLALRRHQEIHGNDQP